MSKITSLPPEGNTNPSLGWALAYVALGRPVFPVNPGNKKPWDPETNRPMKDWHNRATIDSAQVEAWWKKRPDLGVGSATGRRADIVVLDFDVVKGKDGLVDKARLEAHYGKLPETLTQSTPSGGMQEFYRYPEGAEDVPNRVGFGFLIAGHQKATLCGIDVRGDGGQVNVPPTAREAGAYQWHSDPLTTPIADLPLGWQKALSEKTRPDRPERSPYDDPEAELTAFPKGSAESVMAGCAAIEHLKTDPKGITEWSWKMAGGVIGRTERGRGIFKHFSALDPTRYSAADADAALDYMLGKSGPHGCDSFAAEMPDACAGCLFRGKIKGPIELSRQDVELVKLLRRHVYVTDVYKFYDFEGQLVKAEKDFSATYAHLPIKYTVKKEDGGTQIKTDGRLKQTVFINSKLAPKADTGRYTPGEPRRLYPGPHGERIANVWLDDGVPAEPGNCSVWEDHVDWLLPNEEGQRNLFLDVMAFSLQHPNVKVRFAILLISPAQQIGKGAIIETWAAMLGKTNNVTVSNSELRSDFQGGLFNTQLAFFDEVFIRDRDFYNDSKTIITAPEIRAQLKHKDFIEMTPPKVIVASSNKEVPFLISEPEDARWCVIRIDRERREDAYYKRLDTEGPRQIAAWKAKLLRRDLSGFNPAGLPPMTAAKRQLINDSRTPFDRAMDEVLQEHGRQVVVMAELRGDMLQKHIRGSLSETDLQDGLKRRGWKRRGQHKLGIGDLKGSFWTLGEEWDGASAQTMRDALRWQLGGPGDE